MALLTIAYRLPVSGWPKAILETDYAGRQGRLLVEGKEVLTFEDPKALREGTEASLPNDGGPVSLRIARSSDGEPEVELAVDGRPALREDALKAPVSRSAWIHAWLALGASFFGFVASYLYLERAQTFADAWSLKMAIHMAGWHLLLTLTLFPASVWGQRIGIRAVQTMSLLFFLIHAGIALANNQSLDGPWIALFNGASGVLFLAATIYGQRAARDMDPIKALRTRPVGQQAATA